MTDFSQRLKETAHARNLSQRALAKMAGVSPSHLSRLYDGTRAASPSYPVVVRLADALGVPDRWLFWGDSLGGEIANPEHNKNLALHFARAGGISERVLSTVSKEKLTASQEASVLWWVARILALNTLHGSGSIPAPDTARELSLDNSGTLPNSLRMANKGHQLLREKLSERGSQTSLAKRMGTDPATISKVLSRGSCGLELAAAFEEHLGIPIRAWREPVDTSPPAEAAR